MTNGHRQWIETLRGSHDHLSEVVAGLSPERIAGRSYCSEWSTAQVLSHLGSGAEIGLVNLEAALKGEPSPRERYQGIWDVWNAKSPEAMAADSIVADESYVAALEDLDDETLDSVRLTMMGRELDASAIVAMRLFEHSVHTWDVEVIDTPTIEVQDAPSELLVGRLGDRVGRAARGPKPAAAPTRLVLQTTVPSESHTLVIGEEEISWDDDATGDGTLSIPGGALLRLVGGRLDAAHTPSSVTISGPVSLDDLRALFAAG